MRPKPGTSPRATARSWSPSSIPAWCPITRTSAASSPRQQTGLVDMSYVTEAIRYATLMKADVINISLSNVTVSELDLAVMAALDSGIVMVVAAGNNGTPNYIGDGHPDVIVVAASD